MSSLNPSAVLGHRGMLRTVFCREGSLILLLLPFLHYQGDTATCQSMPHEEGTHSPGPGGALPKPWTCSAQPALPAWLSK